MLNDAERSITTIEDPVEVQVAGVDQIEINPKAGLTFASGLRTILRSDPDVILVGEIRDEETAHVAFRAAMTGHLVLSTLHAHSAASSIARLKDMGIDPALLATSVNAVVAQRLARRLCTECRESYKPDSAEAAEVGVRREPHALPPGRLRRLRRHRLQGPRRPLRADDDRGRGPAAARPLDGGDRRGRDRPGHVDAPRRTACVSAARASRRSPRCGA